MPAIVLLNYGTLDVPMPELRFKIPQEGVTLERVQVVKTALEIKGMKLKKSEVYEFTGFAQPAEGDDVFEAASEEAQMGGFGAMFGQEPPPGGKGPQQGKQEPEEKDAGEPVSASKTEAPADPAQEWLAPIKQKFLEARKNGASMADLRGMLLKLHPNTKALARAFANNILAGFAGEQESEEVESANAGESEGSRRRAEPIPQPDGTKCYTENCERHEKIVQENEGLPSLPSSMEVVDVVPELESHGVPGGRVYIRRKLKGKFPIKGRMKNKKKAIGRFKRVLTPPYSVSKPYQEVDANGKTHTRIDIIKSENGVTRQLVVQTSGDYAGGIVTYIDDISKPRMQKRTAGASTIR